MEEIQCAQAGSGFYRCNGLGETAFLEQGDPFPECACSERKATTWRRYVLDNMPPQEEPLGIYLRTTDSKHMVFAYGSDTLPEVGLRFNVKQGQKAMGPETGLYTIEHVRESVEPNVDYEVMARRVGDIDPTLSVHVADYFWC